MYDLVEERICAAFFAATKSISRASDVSRVERTCRSVSTLLCRQLLGDISAPDITLTGLSHVQLTVLKLKVIY